MPRLFLAGILPGLLQAAPSSAGSGTTRAGSNFPVEPSLPLAERLRVTLHAVPALMVPASC